jgi:2-haloacid dehalogenase
MLEAALERSGLRPHLTHVLSGDAVGIYKPALHTYEEAPRRLGVTPETILFVSGNAWDAADAASFGLRVAWLNRAGPLFDALGQRPDWEIASLHELAAAVSNAAAAPRDA